MKTKWGSCNTAARRVWFNLELAKKPVQCLEYIVVHELVHLLERVKRGMAWHYKVYQREQSADERKLYDFTEIEASAIWAWFVAQCGADGAVGYWNG